MAELKKAEDLRRKKEMEDAKVLFTLLYMWFER